jgi:hypothetical protein
VQDDLDDGCWVDYPDETGKPSKQKHITLYFDSLGAHKKVQKEAIEFLGALNVCVRVCARVRVVAAVNYNGQQSTINHQP